MNTIADQCNQLKNLLSGEHSWRFYIASVVTEEEQKERRKAFGIPDTSPLSDFFLIMGSSIVTLTEDYLFSINILGGYDWEKPNFEKTLGCPVEIFATQGEAIIALKLDGSNEVWVESFAGGIPVCFGTFSDFLQHLINEARAAINDDDTVNNIAWEAHIRAYPQDKS
jgi:hypothetical protein